MATLLETANKIAGAALRIERITYGGDGTQGEDHPWLGTMRSVSADQVPPEYIAGGAEFIYLPRRKTFKLRGGQTVKFDTLSGGVEVTGLLPAKWSSKCRWMEEFSSDVITDSVPTVMALLTRETVATGLDDGRFSTVWIRDQVSNANYTFGSEFSATTYPAPGTAQSYKVIPLWYDSGDGGITRGTTEFLRRFFFGGSRRFLKSGRQWYFPSLLGTPARWNGRWTATATQTYANRTIPSGPIPPTHCGTVTPGIPVPATYMRPNADVADGSWLNSAGNNTNMFSYVDEATATDTDWVRSVGSNTTLKLGLETPSTAPTTADEVTLRYRLFNVVVSGHNGLNVYVKVGSTTYANTTHVWGSSTADWTNYGLTLTDTEVSNIITADATWANVEVWFEGSSESAGADNCYISQAYIEVVPAAATAEGGWKGKDRFLQAFYYRADDDSVWAMTQPRLPNDILTAGLDMVTVDAANTDLTYRKITHYNIPIPPQGIKSVGICRTTKIDSTVDDNLLLNPTDLRLIAEVPAGTTSYDDYRGDDESLALDVERAFLRYDHSMTPPSRYTFGGDMRVGAAYGRSQSPCAILIAPVGHATDYDLNVADTSDTAYSAAVGDMYMRIRMNSASLMTLELVKSDYATAEGIVEATLSTTTASNTTLTSSALFGNLQIGMGIEGTGIPVGTTITAIATTSSLTMSANATDATTTDRKFTGLSLATYTTLQKLVDRINSSSFIVYGQQWRAQVCPGTDPEALTSYLLPHSRVIASCVVSGQTITIAGASKVPVGAFISGTGVTVGAYVTQITSATVLTFSGTIAAATVDLTFFHKLGDITISGGADAGYQRVIANSLPGFLYFTKTYLDTFPIEKDSAWMTVAPPGSVKSAPNCWSLKTANHFRPSSDMGSAMGGGAVDQGFVVPYANKTAAIRNDREQGTGRDEDYRFHVLDETKGCVAWNTVVPGNRFVVYLSAEGMCAANLKDVRLISGAIYKHPTSDATSGVGDFDYEAPTSVAATAADSDTAYASARIMRSALYVNYRNDAGHPDRQVVMDFSSATHANGMEALFQAPGVPRGWSTELSRNLTAMCEGRRSDGLHLYGWNEANGGSTGDGRIDEFETGTTDNGTAIVGSVKTPWERAGETDLVSGQEISIEHSSPTGSTGSLRFHRGLADTEAEATTMFSMTPSTTSNVLLTELKMLPQKARANVDACYVSYTQATGSAREIRKVEFRFKRVKRYK